MKRFLSLFWLFALVGFAHAQGPNSPNSGLCITSGSAVGFFNISWWGVAANSYFIQQTDDLSIGTWTYVPIYELGANQVISWGFSSTAPRFFVRLKIDSDGQLMPDDWQMQYFGSTGVDPYAPAPSGNGMTNLAAFLAGVSPLDYYEGELPTLAILDGNNQTGNPGGFLFDPLVVQVSGTDGHPLINAPVTFSVTGGGQVTYSDYSGAATSLVVRTNSNGQAVMQYSLPNVSSTTSQITVTAGLTNIATSTFTETTNSGGSGGSPGSQSSIQNLTTTLNPDGSVDVLWINNSTSTNSISVSITQSDGTLKIVTVPAGSTSCHIPAQ